MAAEKDPFLFTAISCAAVAFGAMLAGLPILFGNETAGVMGAFGLGGLWLLYVIRAFITYRKRAGLLLLGAPMALIWPVFMGWVYLAR